MAVPKRKVSKARRDKRRSNVWKLAVPGIVACPKCGADLNIGPCQCKPETDPRWAALSKLLNEAE